MHVCTICAQGMDVHMWYSQGMHVQIMDTPGMHVCMTYAQCVHCPGR